MVGQRVRRSGQGIDDAACRNVRTWPGFPQRPGGTCRRRCAVLFITGPQRMGGWLAETLAADSATQVLLEEAPGVWRGMARLRDDAYEAVLISHEPPELDALDLVDAVRTASTPQQPIIVLGSQGEAEMTAICFEAGADAYVCVRTATVRTLIWQLSRAAERQKLIAENRRLSQVHRHRLQLEHDEANRLLAQQRTLVASLEKLHQHVLDDPAAPLPCDGPAPPDTAAELPPDLTVHYRELLRAYIIMGSGRLVDEMNRLAELLVCARVSAQQTMHLHLRVLEEMVQNLGFRSARHVMNRADLLVLEVMINLAEQYRQQSLGAGGGHGQALAAGLDLERPGIPVGDTFFEGAHFERK